MGACGDDIDAYFHLAVEFHQQLALASKNKIFFLIWEMFHDVLLKGYIPIVLITTYFPFLSLWLPHLIMPKLVPAAPFTLGW
jgi:hypothetical protein